MPTIDTYDQVGKKEDIADLITNISPTKTPMQTTIGRETVWNTYYQWQEDSLSAPAVNAQIEGAVAPSSTFTATVMRYNTTQIFIKTVAASGSTDAIKAYGRKQELAYQLSKKSAEIKRDLEYALVGTAQAYAVGSDSVARQFGGVQSMIGPTHVFYADTGDNTAPTTPVLTPLSENLVLAANQQLYTDGGEATIFMIKPADALIVAGFAAATGRVRYLDADEKKVVNVVNIYESPFGSQRVVINRFQATNNAFLFDPTYWKLMVMRNWFRENLAKTGDFTEMMLVGEFGLKHRNYLASALLTDLH